MDEYIELDDGYFLKIEEVLKETDKYELVKGIVSNKYGYDEHFVIAKVYKAGGVIIEEWT